MKPIQFNRPPLDDETYRDVQHAIESGNLDATGPFLDACHDELRTLYPNILLTKSCTAGLELCALLLGISPGDEVIVPSYTFPASANAFAIRGAVVKFADSLPETPHVDPQDLEQRITNRTKAIVVVHYAGIACHMDEIMRVANKYSVPVIEDAAQAIMSTYQGKLLGMISGYGTISFHNTKNVSAGEGGAVVLKDSEHFYLAEQIGLNGTNKAAFLRKEVEFYEWKTIGSSYAPSELNCSLLLGQLKRIEAITNKRKEIWQEYYDGLKSIEGIRLPIIPEGSQHNGHIFYLGLASKETRDAFIQKMSDLKIPVTFHYSPLHQSDVARSMQELPNADYWGSCIVRLPLHSFLQDDQVEYIIQSAIKVLKVIS